MGKQVEIETDVQQLVGRKIVTAKRDSPSDPKTWPLNDESLTLTLDDGTIWRFEGEGYDSSRLVIYLTTPE